MDSKNIHIIKSTIDNSLSRFFLSLPEYCETCHQKRIEVALELFIENRSEACVRCSLAAVMLTMVLAIGGHVFGVDNEELKKRFRNPYWRKGLINVLSDLRNWDKLQDECGSCKYKYFCGGFRARAYGYTKDYLAADPGCIRNKKEQN